MSVEAWLSRLEKESDALKQTFLRSATSLKVITNTLTYQTVRNAITIVFSGGSNVFNDPERFIVTFDTFTGSNTIARLEMSTDQQYPFVKVRRLPYSGGARWSVVMNSRDYATWTTTNCQISIHSLVDGSITVSEVNS